MVLTNGFTLNHDKSLQIYFFYVKRQAKTTFQKNVERTVPVSVWTDIFSSEILFLAHKEAVYHINST